jgi:pimeloyl-ACP methyl ester carboxylesterase
MTAPRSLVPVRALSIVTALLLVGCGARVAQASVATSPPSGRAPQFITDTTVVELSDDYCWHVNAGVVNNTGSGLYLDSLIVDIETLGKLDPGASRIQRGDLSGIVRAVGAISAGESADFQFIQLAPVEHAKLTFHLFAHDANHAPQPMQFEVEGQPGSFARDFPSKPLEVAGRKVEYVLLSPLGSSERPAPAVLLIHGHGTSARSMMRTAMSLNSKGWWVAMVSQPGYGSSDGPADFMGPATLAAAEAALAELAKTDGVDRDRIAVWGQSRGATVAALLAQRHPELKGVIVQSGLYDLWAVSRGPSAELRESILAEAGSDSAAWRARSPLLAARSVKVPVLIFHGGKDTQVPVAQANAYAAAIQSGGGTATVEVLPNGGPVVPATFTLRRATDFLGERFKR